MEKLEPEKQGEQYETIKTDLSLLLECLKFQMKCPDLQKQALLTIHSICEKREMGGVAFVYNLSKSSIVHSDVKEAALFTLGTLVEANVYCKNSLCRKETFADLAGSLMKDDIPLTQKRVSVYLLSVLVANNKLGQTLAQTTGCLDILLDLFRYSSMMSTFPLSTDATSVVANATHTYQLWTSVSNALCGCVNNPQNEEGQHICVAAFPIIKIWLQQIALQRIEIFQSICSFVSMTVSNNSCVQESFSASGGLETLTLSLVRLASMADVRLSSYQLSVTISKTLSACVTDNSALASGLAQYGIVSHLFSLLASPYLDPEDRLSVLLTLGHCTEASEEHQSQLVQCGGLPLIITLLAEDKSEEVRKTATFILQTCKQASKSRQFFKTDVLPLLHCILTNCQHPSSELYQTRCIHFKYNMCFLLSFTCPSLLEKLGIIILFILLSSTDQCEGSQQWILYLFLASPLSPSGCVLPFEKVTSRTFASLQSSCPHSCEMHKALQAATQQFRTRHCSLLRREDQDNTVELTSQNSKRVSATEPQRGKEYWSGKRRKRKDFSLEEVRYLLSGVKTFGFSWNSILWSYPFQPGRTNVALAKKYRHPNCSNMLI
uniref:Telomere repeat binding bouquet formation protein 1 n=1 Tax=Seriola lalandi dorsalis TaxID=1841481 RepID=A0A3B4YUK6_SERLL